MLEFLNTGSREDFAFIFVYLYCFSYEDIAQFPGLMLHAWEEVGRENGSVWQGPEWGESPGSCPGSKTTHVFVLGCVAMLLQKKLSRSLTMRGQLWILETAAWIPAPACSYSVALDRFQLNLRVPLWGVGLLSTRDTKRIKRKHEHLLCSLLAHPRCAIK